MTTVVDFKTTYPPGKAPIDWVCVAPSGESYLKCQTWKRISDVRPRPVDQLKDEYLESLSYKVLLKNWEVIGPKYEAWKASSEIPETGMPLGAWSGVSREVAEMLKKQGIRTVEDVAAMSPDSAAKLPMSDGRRLPKMAADFLGGQKDAATIAENEALRERLAAMEEILADMSKEKRGPGRPKKVDAA